GLSCSTRIGWTGSPSRGRWHRAGIRISDCGGGHAAVRSSRARTVGTRRRQIGRAWAQYLGARRTFAEAARESEIRCAARRFIENRNARRRRLGKIDYFALSEADTLARYSSALAKT